MNVPTWLLAITLFGSVHYQKDIGILGIRIRDTGKIKVIKIYLNSPTIELLRVGDEILTVDGKHTTHIPGPIGSPVVLRVNRNGTILDFTFIRKSALELGKNPEGY